MAEEEIIISDIPLSKSPISFSHVDLDASEMVIMKHELEIDTFDSETDQHNQTDPFIDFNDTGSETTAKASASIGIGRNQKTVKLRPYLNSYFRKIIVEDGDSDIPNFKCLQNNCKTILAYKAKNGWRSFPRHLANLHGIIVSENKKSDLSKETSDEDEEMEAQVSSDGEIGQINSIVTFNNDDNNENGSITLKIEPMTNSDIGIGQKQKIVKIQPYLKSYFQQILDEEEFDSQNDIPHFRCLQTNCKTILTYKASNGWRSFPRHLENLHGIIVSENKKSKQTIDENDGMETDANDVNYVETTRVGRKRKAGKIQPYLKRYFQKINEESDQTNGLRFKCLQNNCSTILEYKSRNGWRSFPRHLANVHGIILSTEKKQSAQNEEASDDETHIRKPIQPDPFTRRSMRSRRQMNPMVVLELLRSSSNASSDSDAKFQYKKSTAKVKSKSKSGAFSFSLINSCVICGNVPEKSKPIFYEQEQEDTVESDKNSLPNTICKLLKVSEDRFMNFFQESKYCKDCHRDILGIAEKFMELGRVEKQISEYKLQVESLFHVNWKKVHSARAKIKGKKHENDNSTHESLFKDLMKEIALGSSQEEPKRRAEQFSGQRINVDENSELDENMSAGSDMDYNPGPQSENNSGFEEDEAETENPNKKSKGSTRIFKCRKCAQDKIETFFDNRNSLRRHRDKAHRSEKTKSWTCEKCGKTLIHSKAIQTHKMYAHYHDSELNCPICSLRLPTEEELESHTLLHKTETPFLCVVCQTLSSSSVDLKRHMIAEHPQAVSGGTIRPRTKCEVVGCDRAFYTRGAFVRHMKKHRGEQDPRYKCPHPNCEAFCDNKEDFKYHTSFAHSNISQFQCDICGARHKYKRGFLRHLERHEVLQSGGKFKFECKLCGKTFNSTQRLKRHEEIHSGVKHLCDVCGKSFGAKQGLNQHSRIHKGTYVNYNKNKPRKSQRTTGVGVIIGSPVQSISYSDTFQDGDAAAAEFLVVTGNSSTSSTYSYPNQNF